MERVLFERTNHGQEWHRAHVWAVYAGKTTGYLWTAQDQRGGTDIIVYSEVQGFCTQFDLSADFVIKIGEVKLAYLCRYFTGLSIRFVRVILFEVEKSNGQGLETVACSKDQGDCQQ